MSSIPTRKEILQLPRWARVAFAARCAARVQPRYRGNEAFAIDQAIKVAFSNAARAAYDFHYVHTAADAAHAADAAARAAHAAARDTDDTAAYTAAAAAAAAAESSAYAGAVAAAYADADADADARAAGDAAAIAARAADGDATFELIRDDFHRLLHLTTQHTNRDSVDHWKLLGPLWPDGVPQWFLEGSRWHEKQLGHPLYRDDGMPWDDQPDLSDEHLSLGQRIRQSEPNGLVYADFIGEFTEDEYELCLEYLSEVYRETGGLGLKVVHSESLGFVPSEVSNDD